MSTLDQKPLKFVPNTKIYPEKVSSIVTVSLIVTATLALFLNADKMWKMIKLDNEPKKPYAPLKKNDITNKGYEFKEAKFTGLYPTVGLEFRKEDTNQTLQLSSDIGTPTINKGNYSVKFNDPEESINITEVLTSAMGRELSSRGLHISDIAIANIHLNCTSSPEYSSHGPSSLDPSVVDKENLKIAAARCEFLEKKVLETLKLYNLDTTKVPTKTTYSEKQFSKDDISLLLEIAEDNFYKGKNSQEKIHTLLKDFNSADRSNNFGKLPLGKFEVKAVSDILSTYRESSIELNLTYKDGSQVNLNIPLIFIPFTVPFETYKCESKEDKNYLNLTNDKYQKILYQDWFNKDFKYYELPHQFERERHRSNSQDTVEIIQREILNRWEKFEYNNSSQELFKKINARDYIDAVELTIDEKEKEAKHLAQFVCRLVEEKQKRLSIIRKFFNKVKIFFRSRSEDSDLKNLPWSEGKNWLKGKDPEYLSILREHNSSQSQVIENIDKKLNRHPTAEFSDQSIQFFKKNLFKLEPCAVSLMRNLRIKDHSPSTSRILIEEDVLEILQSNRNFKNIDREINRQYAAEIGRLLYLSLRTYYIKDPSGSSEKLNLLQELQYQKDDLLSI